MFRNSSGVGTTLCPVSTDNSLNLSIATYSFTPLHFTIRIVMEEYKIHLNQTIRDKLISPSEPQVLYSETQQTKEYDDERC